jgi:hypothetical protein
MNIAKSAAARLEVLCSLQGTFVTEWASASKIPSGWNTAAIPTINHSNPKDSIIKKSRKTSFH